MDQLPANRRRFRFRFGLRTLLAVVALAAVGSWAYWFGWPWWVDYRLRRAVELAAAKLHVDYYSLGFDSPSLDSRFCVGDTWHDFPDDTNSDWRDWRAYEWPNATYVICRRWTRDAPTWKPISIRVYRLPIPAANYRAVTKRARDELARWIRVQFARSRFENLFDFLEMTARNNDPTPGFEYELIYSDPPATPAAK